MGWFDFLRVKSAPKVPPPIVREIVREAVQKPGAPRDGELRRLTSQDGRRDLSPVRYDYHLRLCAWLWAMNPIAKRGIQNMRAFVASEGFRAQATSSNDQARARVQQLLNEHWRINQWDDELSRRVETLGVEGEWIYYCPPPNPGNGHFRICKILPETIKEICRDPGNAELLSRVILQQTAECMGQPVQEFRVANLDETGQVSGNCLYLGINRLSGQCRGWSDLLVAADYIECLDRLVFTETDRVQLQRAFVWDVAIKGTQEEAKLRAARDRILAEGPPKPGSLRVHDDSETWTAIAPELHLSDSVELLRFVQAICFGALGMPQHFFSEGGDVNKATAQEMGSPIWASIRDRKRAIQAFLRTEIQLALQRFREVGQMAGIDPVDESFEVVSRDPERNAYDLTGQMLRQVGEGLALGVEARFCTQAQASQAYRTAASSLGLGDFQDSPDPGSLDDAAGQVAQAMEARRPALERMTPIAV